jgi:hypothetical protein
MILQIWDSQEAETFLQVWATGAQLFFTFNKNITLSISPQLYQLFNKYLLITAQTLNSPHECLLIPLEKFISFWAMIWWGYQKTYNMTGFQSSPM